MYRNYSKTTPEREMDLSLTERQELPKTTPRDFMDRECPKELPPDL